MQRSIPILLSVMASSFVTALPAQQPPTGRGGMQGGAGVGTDNSKILIVAENPAIDHKTAPNMGMGSASVTSANFWRVYWSPVGPGTACFITVNEPTPNAQKFVITDNPKLVEYISSKEIIARLLPNWNEPAWKVIPGTVTQATKGNESRTETCKGGDYTVELKWFGGITEPRWIDFGFARQFGITMTISMAGARQHEILINGKRAPGQYASGTLALNETWRIEN